MWDKGGKLGAGAEWNFDWAMINIFDCDEFSSVDGLGSSYKIVDCPEISFRLIKAYATKWCVLKSP